jgi:Tfp pilus assembly protein PilN
VRPVNLVPSEHRAQATGAQSGSAYVIVGLLALLLGVVAFYVITTNQVNQRKADASDAKAQADALEARASQLASFTSFSAIKQTRLESVRSVADGRFDWERMMRELSRVIPSGSWLLEVDGSTGSSPTDASSAAAQPGQETAPTYPTAKLTGCAPSQTDVAKMMTRLREMHAVNDVTLTDSSRGDDTGGASVTEGCTDYQFNVTVNFGATDAKEAPRGQKRVPASLGGGK